MDNTQLICNLPADVLTAILDDQPFRTVLAMAHTCSRLHLRILHIFRFLKRSGSCVVGRVPRRLIASCGCTPITMAAERGELGLLRYLLRQLVTQDPNVANLPSRSPPVHVACTFHKGATAVALVQTLYEFPRERVVFVAGLISSEVNFLNAKKYFVDLQFRQSLFQQNFIWRQS